MTKHVLLPAGTIRMIDTVEEKVYVDRTKDQIKDAPEFDESKHGGEQSYLEQNTVEGLEAALAARIPVIDVRDGTWAGQRP